MKIPDHIKKLSWTLLTTSRDTTDSFNISIYICKEFRDIQKSVVGDNMIYHLTGDIRIFKSGKALKLSPL